MHQYLTLLLIPAIGYFGWTCGRSHGLAGFCVFAAAFAVLAVAVVMNPSGAEAGQSPVSMVAVIGAGAVLAVISGAFGVAKRRAVLQSAGLKLPRNG